MIKKFFLALLSGLLGLFGAVFAMSDSGAVSSDFTLHANNLPLAFSGEFTLDLQVISQAPSSEKELQLSFSQCGMGNAELFYQNEKKTDQISTFYLGAQAQKNFSLFIKKTDPLACQLDFHLNDAQSATELAKTSLILRPSCTQPIDFDEEVLRSGVVVPIDNQTSSLKPNKSRSTAPTLSQKKTLDPELQSAYERAVAQGFFVDSADARTKFHQPMRRMELAQMLSQIVDQLQLEVRSEKACAFADLKSSPEATKATAQRVCQLDLMGINPDQTALENFMPDEMVDRAQMITVISRLLWGDAFNEGGITFYEKHLEKAESEQLISQTDPAFIEAQGYFYLVLQRASMRFPLKKEAILPQEEQQKGFFGKLF